MLLQSADLKTLPRSTTLISVNTQCCLQSFIRSTNSRLVHVLRSCRCLIITAHLLIRATEPGVFDKCFSPSQSVQKRRRRKIRPNLISYYHNCTIITVRPHNIYINAHFTSDRTTACVSPAKQGAAVGGFTLANPIQLIIFNIVLLY